MPLYVRLLLITGPPEDTEAAAAEHAEHLRDLSRRGKLHLSGAFSDGDGYLEILDVEDLHEAERLNAESPLVRDGLASWTLRAWTPLSFE